MKTYFFDRARTRLSASVKSFKDTGWGFGRLVGFGLFFFISICTSNFHYKGTIIARNHSVYERSVMWSGVPIIVIPNFPHHIFFTAVLIRPIFAVLWNPQGIGMIRRQIYRTDRSDGGVWIGDRRHSLKANSITHLIGGGTSTINNWQRKESIR